MIYLKVIIYIALYVGFMMLIAKLMGFNNFDD